MTVVGRGRRRKATREEVLAVARDHAITYGWQQARVQQIAADVGISRPTLYKDFPSKEDLGQALVVAEVGHFVTELRAVIRETEGDITECIRAAVLFALNEADRGPFLAALLTEDRHGEGRLLPTFTERRSVVPKIGADSLRALLVERFPDVDRQRLAFSVTAVVRLTISFLVDPPEEPRAMSASHIAELVTRYLDPS